MRFAFRLALAMGRPDPYKMLDEMPAGLFEKWWAYYEVEPWANQNVQLASILSALTGQPVHKFGVAKKPMTSADARKMFSEMGLTDG